MIDVQSPPRGWRAAGPEINCNALDKPQFINQTAARQAQNQRSPRAVREARLRLRRQRLVEHLHRLGPSPLGHFIREVEEATGADVTARMERYAEIDPEFGRALGGDQFPPRLHVIDGGEP